MKTGIIYVLILLAAAGLWSCGSDEDPTTECVTDSFTFDNTIRPLCGIDAVANHAVIENLVLGGGTFTLYARTSSNGNGGGAFAFIGTDLKVTYNGAGSGSVTSGTNPVAMTGKLHWLFGFFDETPAVHCVVKNHATDPEALEDAEAALEVEPDEWTSPASPVSESFYYKGTGGVTVDRVRIFHEEHHHE